jgi:DNA polymerase III epsilon subunit-like protein
VANDEIVSTFHKLVKHDLDWIPESDTFEKTGLSNELLFREGLDIEVVLKEFVQFIGSSILVTHFNAFIINYVYDIL